MFKLIKAGVLTAAILASGVFADSVSIGVVDVKDVIKQSPVDTVSNNITPRNSVNQSIISTPETIQEKATQQANNLEIINIKVNVRDNASDGNNIAQKEINTKLHSNTDPIEALAMSTEDIAEEKLFSAPSPKDIDGETNVLQQDKLRKQATKHIPGGLSLENSQSLDHFEEACTWSAPTPTPTSHKITYLLGSWLNPC